jgi:hypothetical protein
MEASTSTVSENICTCTSNVHVYLYTPNLIAEKGSELSTATSADVAQQKMKVPFHCDYLKYKLQWHCRHVDILCRLILPLYPPPQPESNMVDSRSSSAQNLADAQPQSCAR